MTGLSTETLYNTRRSHVLKGFYQQDAR